MNTLIWVLIIFVALWAGMGGFFIYRFLTYKHDFILKRPQGKSFVAYKTRAKEFKEKNGTTMWKLLKYHKEPVPVPPKSALAINKKGKFFVEGWLLEDEQMQYESHPQVAGVDISSSNQKILLANQIETAKSERSKSWKEMIGQYIMPLGCFLILGLVVVMGMIFWGDMTAPGLEAKAIYTTQLDIQNENLKILKEIKNDIQIIDEVKSIKSDNNRPPE